MADNYANMRGKIEGGFRLQRQQSKNKLADRPSISIITVVFNGKNCLAETIHSVLEQSYQNKEYIIIDGASTDGTVDIIRKYNDIIDYWRSEPDEGISDAFNKGIELASGDIIGLINADDQLLPGVFEKVSNYFFEHPDAQVVHGDVLLYKRTTFIKRIKPSKRWWTPWRFVLFNHPATFVKREVYQEHGIFNKKYRIAMDVEMYLRWVRAGVKIVYLPEPLVKMQSGGLSSSRSFEGYKEARDAFLEKGFAPFLTHMHYLSKLALHVLARAQIAWKDANHSSAMD